YHLSTSGLSRKNSILCLFVVLSIWVYPGCQIPYIHRNCALFTKHELVALNRRWSEVAVRKKKPLYLLFAACLTLSFQSSFFSFSSC
ncbi:hypothetical protein PMAYCL1PPCAC_11238, partial [Pristionchus mayeri]